MDGEEGASGGAQLTEPAPALPAEPVTARKPRGRPLGSKNKPKPPVVVTRESEAAMRPVVLELAAGCDVVAAVSAFARRRRVGVSVLCGRGAVAAVTLRLAAAASASAAVTLHGRFEVLALSGTVLPFSSSSSSLSSSPAAAGSPAPQPPFSVSLAGAGGQVIGGTLVGEMTAADGVVVVAATFGIAEVHRLPAAGVDDEDEGGGDSRGASGREEGRHLHPPPPPQQQVAAGADDVVGLVGGYGGAGSGGGHGHVGQQAQLPDMGLWGQPTATPTRGPVHPLPHFYNSRQACMRA